MPLCSTDGFLDEAGFVKWNLRGSFRGWLGARFEKPGSEAADLVVSSGPVPFCRVLPFEGLL